MSTGSKKRDEVERLIGLLQNNDKSHSLSDDQLRDYIGQLKVHGRDAKDADAIFSRSGIDTLAGYAFGEFNHEIALEAGRCIANALFLDPSLRQTFIDLGLPGKAAAKLDASNDDRFLMSRILFLSTYGTKLDWQSLIVSDRLAEHINSAIRHLANESVNASSPVSAEKMPEMALNEVLKLHFSVASTAPLQVHELSASLQPLLRLVENVSIPNPPLQPLFSTLINAIANLEFTTPCNANGSSSTARPNEEAGLRRVIEKLVDALKRATLAYNPFQLETSAIPLLTVLRKLYEASHQPEKELMQKLLLPANNSRDDPIGKGDDLPSRLLRLTTSSGMVNLSECISGLMFELSGKDANQYVLNVGFGFAAGYLATHGIPVPENAGSTTRGRHEVPINPITGQRLDREPADTRPSMTREEKEREAERLFVLFEKLKATGVVDVENPVRKAMAEGSLKDRVEELSDSE